MQIRTRLTAALGVAHPVLLAPMDIVADARLTAAVSGGGGFGILGGGYGDADWLERELAELANHGIRYGVGFITWSMARNPTLLDRTLARKPAAVMLSFGSPAPFVEKIKRAGSLAICQVQSLNLAREAVSAGADILVAQGTEGGGHGASRGVVTLVPELVDALGNKAIVVAAGGLADGRGLAAALALGADGILMGTRFYASQEAAAADAAKERIRAAGGDDAVRSIVFDISRQNVWPAPFTGRCLRNRHLDAWLGKELELLRSQDTESAKYLEARQAGDFEIAAVIAGESSGLIHDVPLAREIIERTVEEAASFMKRGRADVEVVGG